MFFRPSYCANCGEKIERAEWHVWTSRRFCPVCESQHKGYDLIPRVIVGLGIAAGVFGFGSYLKSSPADVSEKRTSRQLRGTTKQYADNSISPRAGDQRLSNTETRGISELNAVNTLTQVPPVERAELRAPVTRVIKPEPGYFCGAETKKGTPCSRRVKGNVRCYQHPEMPAMLPAEKLKIKKEAD